MKTPTINFQSDFALKDFPLLKAEAEINNWLSGQTGSVFILEDGKAKQVSLNFTRSGKYAIDKQEIKRLVVLYSVDKKV